MNINTLLTKKKPQVRQKRPLKQSGHFDQGETKCPDKKHRLPNSLKIPHFTQLIFLIITH